MVALGRWRGRQRRAAGASLPKLVGDRMHEEWPTVVVCAGRRMARRMRKQVRLLLLGYQAEYKLVFGVSAAAVGMEAAGSLAMDSGPGRRLQLADYNRGRMRFLVDSRGVPIH